MSSGDATAGGPQRAAAQRLFIALWPPHAVREALVRWQQQWQWPPQARPVKPESLHLTLHFLGNVEAARMPALREALRVPSPAFTLDFGRPQTWSGIAVCRPLSIPEALTALHAQLAERLSSLSIPLEERTYKPHVTLARKAFGATPPGAPLDLRWEAREGHVLVRTIAGNGTYEIVQRYPG